MTNSLEVLDHVRLNFSPSGLVFLNIALAFIMFGVALGIKVENFEEIIRKPKSAIVGFISQAFLLPAFTFLLVLLLNPTPTIALGMILVAACPGGNISNFISSMARGNVALSVSLTAASTSAAIFFTPFNFALWGNFYINFYNTHEAAALLRPLEIDKAQMFQTVFILLGIPVIIGLFVANKFPKLTSKIIKPINKGSLLFFVMMVIAMLSANFTQFLSYVHLVFFIVLLHNGLALSTGYFFSKLMKLPSNDQRTVAIETGIQNSGLALALMFNPKIFPPEMELGGMAIIAAWWGIWHIISGLTLAFFWSRKPILA
ncbi:Na(+) dependent transporter,Sodium Bile acid symporter family [Aquipluma nitroreducens]|uniref:Na(+) dependent transporter,Sodium Bile acid symporter family n=1 Tax=Aquipluma nitroreducens TaxID=2010828 RepID=A0A5K7SB91_9BACT|nr:bile acid:sodium symporter family protein [Aquipluma nitroreducens]BBE18830.1 Na(+) dependent transporter,Sodium Bile acid symporter family [Aquipluma nitroreducens]